MEAFIANLLSKYDWASFLRQRKDDDGFGEGNFKALFENVTKFAVAFSKQNKFCFV